MIKIVKNSFKNDEKEKNTKAQIKEKSKINEKSILYKNFKTYSI